MEPSNPTVCMVNQIQVGVKMFGLDPFNFDLGCDMYV